MFNSNRVALEANIKINAIEKDGMIYVPFMYKEPFEELENLNKSLRRENTLLLKLISRAKLL